MKYLTANSRGFALPLVVMATAILMVLATGFITISSREKQGARDEINLIRAMYLADAGVELALQGLEDEDFSWSNFSVSFGEGEAVKVSSTAGEAGDNLGETWHYDSEGVVYDQQGKLLAKRIIQATVKKGFLPRQFEFGINPGNYLLLGDTEEPEETVFFRQGDLSIGSWGEFKGKYIIAVDGTVTVQGDLIPAGPEDSLIIISSRQVEFAGGVTVWAVVFSPTSVLGSNSTLFGLMVCGTAIEQTGALYVNDADTAAFIDNSRAFVEQRVPYRPVLVRWREVYPVF